MDAHSRGVKPIVGFHDLHSLLESLSLNLVQVMDCVFVLDPCFRHFVPSVYWLCYCKEAALFLLPGFQLGRLEHKEDKIGKGTGAGTTSLCVS